MITASILEGVLSGIYISLMYFMASGFKNSDQYLDFSLQEFCLALSLFNGASAFFSISVDLFMYPMFIKVFFYFVNLYRKRNETVKPSIGSKSSQSLPLRIKLRISLVVYLFFITFLHSIYTHFLRIWQTIDPLKFIEINNTEPKTELYEDYKMIEEFAINMKDICMGTAFTCLAYYLTLSAHQYSTGSDSK
jgi:hypothetical protein